MLYRAAAVGLATAICATRALAECPQASDLHADNPDSGVRITFANDGFVDVWAEPSFGDDGMRVSFVWDPDTLGQALYMARGIFVTELYFLEADDTAARDAPSISFTFAPSIDTFPEPEPETEWLIDVTQIGGQHDRTIQATYRWGEAASIDIGDCTYASLPLSHTQEHWSGGTTATDYIYLPELGFAFMQGQRIGDEILLDLEAVEIAHSTE